MRPDCIQEIEKALGRALKKNEAQNIEDRINRKAQQLWRTDADAMRKLSKDEQMRKAASAAADDFSREAELQQRRTALAIAKHDEIKGYLDQQGHSFANLNKVVAFDAAMGAGRTSIESNARAIYATSIGRLNDLAEAAQGRFLGIVENVREVEDAMRALFGEKIQNEKLKSFVKEWATVTEELRTRFNRAGGRIGSLGIDWRLPQSHDALRIAKAGKAAWTKFMLGAVDRSRYINADGSRFSDEQMTAHLASAWESLATGGLNDFEPGTGKRRAMVANKNAAHRELFFKNADSYIEYQKQFGNKNLYETLFGHIQRISRDIALAETLGPNADLQFQHFRDSMLAEQVMANPWKKAKFEAQAKFSQRLYDEVAGNTPPIANGALARNLAAVRSWLTASRLGSAVISSLGDEATMHQTAKLWNLPEMKMYRQYLAALNPKNADELRLARRAGLAIETFTSSLNRFGADVTGHFAPKVASVVMRASGLNALTDARRRAFSATMMSALGHITKTTDFAHLDASDHKILIDKGVTDTEFAVWKKAALEDWGNGNDTLLTPDAIRAIPDAALKPLGDPIALREQAITKLMAVVLEEQNMAVVEPGARERAMLYFGTQRGTFGGELARSVMQFKMFPITMITRHWKRGLSMSRGSSLAYLGTLMTTSTLLGMLALETNEVISGRDPRKLWDSSNPKRALQTWGAAVLKGGALGIFGDFLFSNQTRYGQSIIATSMGPTAGLAEDIYNATWGNAIKASQGEKTDTGADLVRLGKSVMPGASLWYAKAALDHLLFHDAQELASPGYLSRMRNRVRRDTGQSFWWQPGEALPDRAPNAAAAVGE